MDQAASFLLGVGFDFFGTCWTKARDFPTPREQAAAKATAESIVALGSSVVGVASSVGVSIIDGMEWWLAQQTVEAQLKVAADATDLLAWAVAKDCADLQQPKTKHEARAAALTEERKTSLQLSLRAAELLQESLVFTCAICQEELDISDKLIVDCCDKDLCRECLKRYITGEFEPRRFPVRCPFSSPGCIGQLSESTLNLIATDAQLELLRDWSRRPTHGSRPCPVPDCRGFSLQDDEAEFCCRCVLCHHHWCCGVGCEQADLVRSQHAGITCEKYAQWRRDNAEADTLTEAFVTTALADHGDDRIRSCPNCGFRVSKDKMCNHVVCPECHCHWCFRCAAFHAADATAVYHHQSSCQGL
jgi:hypothetical protein